MRVREMLQSHPRSNSRDLNVLAACIEECFSCAQTCTTCADACLAEEKVSHLRRCIRTDLDCAEVCATTGRLLSRLTESDWTLLRAQVEACRTACRVCAAECEQHAEMHTHCRICAEACRKCEEACARLLEALPAS